MLCRGVARSTSGHTGRCRLRQLAMAATNQDQRRARRGPIGRRRRANLRRARHAKSTTRRAVPGLHGAVAVRDRAGSAGCRLADRGNGPLLRFCRVCSDLDGCLWRWTPDGPSRSPQPDSRMGCRMQDLHRSRRPRVLLVWPTAPSPTSGRHLKVTVVSFLRPHSDPSTVGIALPHTRLGRHGSDVGCAAARSSGHRSELRPVLGATVPTST